MLETTYYFEPDEQESRFSIWNRLFSRVWFSRAIET